MWGAIKKAINNSLGMRSFLPLDEIVSKETYERYYDNLLLNAPTGTEIVGREKIEPLNRGGSYTVEDNIINVVLPWGVKIIPAGFCIGNSTIKNIIMPNTVEVIGESAFRFTTIETIRLSNKLTRIENTAFFGCENLKLLRLPETTRSFGVNVFANCNNLAEIHTPLPALNLENLGISENTDIYYNSL